MKPFRRLISPFLLVLALNSSWALGNDADSALCDTVSALARPGDVVFIHIDNAAFKKISRATGGWANHVGVILHKSGNKGWVVAESKLPVSRTDTLCSFVDRSSQSRVAMRRLPELSETNPDIDRIQREALARMGIAYDLKFNLDSKKQYCSKFVYEVFRDALGVEIGSIETLADLMERLKQTPYFEQDYQFWKFYYGGQIPLEQRIVTPQSQYLDPKLVTIFDNSIED